MKRAVIILAVLVLGLVGCGLERRLFPRPSAEEMDKEVKRMSETPVTQPAAGPTTPGSLWPADDHVFFYGDKKALRVGDTLTIRIVETAQAESKADTELSRKSAIQANLENVFRRQDFFKFFHLGKDILKSDSENSHTGEGSTTREGKLTASITAVVTHVLPNGNLIVKANRSVMVNNEEQFITLTGMVRPQDINRDNVVLSSQVADANITFAGAGVVADKQRSGWGVWLFDWLWPF